jgi:hypothetical protein
MISRIELISHWGIISLSQMISRTELISHWGIISLSQMISRVELISHWGIISLSQMISRIKLIVGILLRVVYCFNVFYNKLYHLPYIVSFVVPV